MADPYPELEGANILRAPAGGAYRVWELPVVTGPAAVVVTVLDEKGKPVKGLVVCWSWPDAPRLSGAGWDGRAELGRTDAQGQVGFPMGKGAWYTPPQSGPHSVWLYGDGVSDYVGGLGMIAGTPHTHRNVVFRWVPGDESEPEPDPDDAYENQDNWDLLFDKLDEIIRCLRRSSRDCPGSRERAEGTKIIDYRVVNQ
jgi:hypothetical protein